jgi:hypothetical protein
MEQTILYGVTHMMVGGKLEADDLILKADDLKREISKFVDHQW